MPFFEWHDKYNLNLPAIDEQHQAIAAMISNLQESLAKGIYNDENISSVLIPIVECVKYHFQAEEKLLKDANYSDYHYHKGLHERFTEQVMSYIVSLKKKEQINLPELLALLRDWFAKHILTEDKKFAAALMPSKKVAV